MGFKPTGESFGSAPQFAGAGKPFSKPEGGFKGGFKEGFKDGPKPAFAKTGFKPAGKSFASKAPRKA